MIGFDTYYLSSLYNNGKKHEVGISSEFSLVIT